jgi:hypothetical protein
MSVKRQGNWLSQQRVDVPHFRALESSIASDFDDLAGVIMSGRKSFVITGLTFASIGTAITAPATSLQLVVAGAKIFHYNGSEAGTMLVFDKNLSNELLTSTNTKVKGAFLPSTTHYVGLDLIREVDDAGTDIVQFLDADTKQEVPKTTPISRVLNYRIIISTQPFAANSFILPIAQVVTTGANNVSVIYDARPLLFGLSTGGDSPDQNHSYPWVQRTRNIINISNPGDPDPFVSGDKELTSMKDWCDAVMTRIWEIAGGEHWAAPTGERDIKVAYGTPVLIVNSENWFFDGTHISWAGIKVLFSNSPATSCTVADNVSGSTIVDGQCVYVDVDRKNGGTVTAAIGSMAALGQGAVPGSRIVLAWRVGGNVYERDYRSEGALTFPQTKIVYNKGLVYTSVNATCDGFAWILPMNAGGNLVHFQFLIPQGATPTRLHIYGEFVGGGVGSLDIKALMHSQFNSTSFGECHLTCSANPQTFEASAIANVLGTTGPVGAGHIQMILASPTALTPPSSTTAAAYYTLTMAVTIQTTDGATTAKFFGVGVEYTFGALGQI